MSDSEEMSKEIEELKRQNLLNKVLTSEEYKKLPHDLLEKLVVADEKTTKENIELLKKHMLDSKVEKLNLKGNPWSKEHYNLTMQGKVLKVDPELAKKYMAEAE